MASPLLILVGADKGGVGKTTIARALVEYLGRHKVVPRVFDAQFPKGDLARFCKAQIVDITSVEGQMRVFDALSSSGVILVDLPAGALMATIDAIHTIGLHHDVRDRKIGEAVVHVLDSNEGSLNEIAPTAAALGENAVHVLVKNCRTSDAQFFEIDQERYAAMLKAVDADAIITVPNLKTKAAEEVEHEGVTFAAYALNQNLAQGKPDRSRVLRGYVRDWITKTEAQFDAAGIGALVAQG